MMVDRHRVNAKILLLPFQWCLTPVSRCPAILPAGGHSSRSWCFADSLALGSALSVGESEVHVPHETVMLCEQHLC